MNITQQQLKQIIKEEVQKELLAEANDPYFYTNKIHGGMQDILRGLEAMLRFLPKPFVATHPQAKAALTAYENLEVANSNAMKITQPILDAIRKEEIKRADAIKGKAG